MSAKQSQRFDPSAPHRLDSLAPRGAASDVASVEGSTMPEQDDEDDGDANDDEASLVSLVIPCTCMCCASDVYVGGSGRASASRHGACLPQGEN